MINIKIHLYIDTRFLSLANLIQYSVHKECISRQQAIF